MYFYRIEKEKEEPTDAMDGLSDSDLETLLKNFNELSAEEQHSLIAYLKKLEARDPQRVEKLRQYVSAAATTAPKAEDPPPAAPAPAPAKKAPETEVKLVTIESDDDDDDYTVDDVSSTSIQICLLVYSKWPLVHDYNNCFYLAGLQIGYRKSKRKSNPSRDGDR